MSEYVKFIDLKKDLKKSSIKLLRVLPGFMVNYIRKIIREDSLNDTYHKYKHLDAMQFVRALLFKEFKIKINSTGEENIKKANKYIYVANHPLGAIDALSFLHLIDSCHGSVISPSNELFEYIPNLHPLIVGINVFGQNTREKIKKVNEAFKTDAQIMIFPAGEVSRKIDGKIRDPKWQKMFVSKAVEFKRDIVPVYISGRNSSKFYKTAQIRKFLGIKMYVETLLLPQEMFKQEGMELNMTIGKPISYKEIQNSKESPNNWAEKIKEYVYSLKNS